MELNEKEGIKEILLKLKKSDSVNIILKNGKEYIGKILNVGILCIQLQLHGNRSFYDSIIRIDDISAVEFKVRG
ncbi:MAG: hypothetical protein ACFFAN_08680 [Promethearchaeota archaeon]